MLRVKDVKVMTFRFRFQNNLSNKEKKGKEKKSLLEAFTSHKGNYIAAIQHKNDIHICVQS